MTSDMYRFRTHCHVTGTTHSGKSKLVEHWLRAHIMARPRPQGFCLVDWHGTLYENVLRFLTLCRPEVPVILLNPSAPTRVIPFDPFRAKPGADIPAHVANVAETILQAWATLSVNEMPTYRRVIKMLLTFCAITDEPLHHAVQLLYFHHRDKSMDAAAKMLTPNMADEFMDLAMTTSKTEWDRTVLSLRNRLDPFVAGAGIARFMGLKAEGGFDVNEAVAAGAIVLVNLAPSYRLDAESARMFGAILLSEFLRAAIAHANEERPYYLYLDECQNYVTDQAAQMLDGVAKTGLRLTLIHHDMGQFAKKEALTASLRTNARIKAVFAEDDPEQAKRWAEHLFLHEINERQIKERLMRLETAYELEEYETETFSSGASDGLSESEDGEHRMVTDGSFFSGSTATGTRYAPRQKPVTASIYEWSYEEKVAKAAELVMGLKTGECWLKTPEGVEHYRVPFVGEVLPPAHSVLQFEKDVSPHALSLQDADRIIREENTAFAERRNEIAKPRSRGKKKPLRLHEQG